MGVEKKVLTPGDSKTFPKVGDMLTMHYTGTLTEGGKQFDSSVARGKPFQFVIGIGQVIQGWDNGVMDGFGFFFRQSTHTTFPTKQGQGVW